MEEKKLKIEVLNAALAGLLHDIGKIQQRALVTPQKSAPGFESEDLPVYATYSAYFAQTYVPEKYRGAALVGAYHHAPERSPGQDKFLSKLVALADKLSAGEQDDPADDNHQPHQMISIFDRVALSTAHREKDWDFLPLRPLMLDKNALFPGGKKDTDAEGDGYQILLETLTVLAEQDTGDMQSYVENMLGALQVAAWCVPSAFYYSAPDVSLYDHSRMTAALAVCMSGKSEDEVDTLLTAVRNAFQEKTALPDTPVATLIGGDISGIQNFIYTITSKKAAQTLRGRSFYLQLLTEAVLRFVLNELGLPYTNVIYSGGGHFFLLAPITDKEKLHEIRRDVTRKMLAHHGTSLYFALGSTDVPASGFEAGKFPDYWDKMHADLGHAKQHRHTELGTELYERVFAVPRNGGNPDSTCSVCGGDTLNVTGFTDYDEAQARICTLCNSFAEEIGSVLPHTDFVALGRRKPQDAKVGTLSDALESFGLEVQLLKNKADPVRLDNSDHITIWALDDPKHGYPKTDKTPTTYMLRYTVNDIPQMTFDELQDQVDNGFKRLGVLRMDVDSLGEIFKKGLGKFATLARISTLSFQMSLFFEGWTKRICDLPEFKGKIYAVYAGGDDVFLVGPWDVMPVLAMKIRTDFAEYTGQNSDLHISAGMAFIGGKYPIYQAAEDAEHLLQSAKQGGRNAFGFIGSVWKWTEFEEMQEKFERLVKIVDEKQLNGPQAIIHTLRELAELRVKKIKKTKLQDVWGPWQWRGAYLLKRMEEREKGNPALANEIKSVREDLEPNYANINQWGAAARWAQLKTRKKLKKDDELA